MSKATPSAAAVETPEPTAKEAPAVSSRFRVRLNCPTPLVHKDVVLNAATPEDAKQAFMRLNGISGSGHEWTVEPTTEPATELKK